MRVNVMKFLFLVLAVLTLLFQSCTPFKVVSNTINQRTEISGVYSNDCDSTNNKHASKKQLWQSIDEKYIEVKPGLVVKVQETKKNKLFAQLIECDSVIREKIITGYFKDDQCYYKRRFFYVVPILPVLWWFETRQTRLYRNQDYLVLEEKYDTGGAIIIMAGENTTNTNRFYKKIR